VLSDVLRSLRASGSVYFCDRLTAPWTKTFDDPSVASFHQVRRGTCRLLVGDHTSLLGPGDLVFLGPGVEHVLDSETPEASGSPDGEGTLLLCGYCEFELGGEGPAASLFPEIALMPHERLRRRGWLSGVLDRLSEEYMAGSPGSTLVVERLTEVLVVELIRADFGRDGQGELLRALADPPVAAALKALHAHPERAWTLDTLARQVGLSRAGFAARFRERVGQPMFAYLTGLRVQRACTLLAESTLPTIEIAARVGYESEVAFAKMFRKRTGATPFAWRRARRD